MAHEWMIDVLADLRQYAVRHYHLRLAEQLDDAIVVAAVELRAAAELDDPEDALESEPHALAAGLSRRAAFAVVK